MITDKAGLIKYRRQNTNIFIILKGNLFRQYIYTDIFTRKNIIFYSYVFMFNWTIVSTIFCCAHFEEDFDMLRYVRSRKAFYALRLKQNKTYIHTRKKDYYLIQIILNYKLSYDDILE
jgi:hypothetical protein